MYVIQWFSNLMKFRILKYEYLFSFFAKWEKNLLLVQQEIIIQSNSISQLKVNNSKLKFRKISKSPDEISRT